MSNRSSKLFAAIVVLAAAFGHPELSGQSAPPSDLALDLLEVLNTADSAVRRAFLARTLADRARGDSARIDALLTRMTADGAPYRLEGREDDGRHVILKLLSPRAARVVTLHLATDKTQTGALATAEVLATHAAVLDSLQWPAGPLTSSGEPARVIGDNLDRLGHARALSGVVYILQGDSVLVARSYGLANKETGTANGVETRFAMASMSKMFVATAILQLADAGKLRLTDTVADVLPAYPNADRARRITVRQLLEHTSGLGDQWSTPKKPVAGLTGQLAIAGAIAHAPLLFEPGSRWSYSNEGYTLLAAIIEEVSGESFLSYLEKHILARAGMTETVLAGGRDDFVPQRAVGYRAESGDLLGTGTPRANWSFLGEGGMSGAGGGYSTVRDLARFGTALREGRLISPALRDSMWTARWPIPGHRGEQYGWGSFVSRIGGRTAVGHGGGGTGSGMDNGFRQFTDGSYTIVVLTNMDPPTATNLTRSLVKLLAEQPE